MPSSIIVAALSAVGASAAASAVATFATTFLGKILFGVIGAVISMGVNAAFAKKPKKAEPFQRQAVDRMQTIRSPVAPHQIIYGETRVSGPLIFATSSGAQNAYIHLIVPLAGHEVAGIDSVYMNDDEIPTSALDGSGNVTTGTYANLVRIKKYLGTTTQTADPDLIAEAPNSEWTSTHVGKGIAYLYVRLNWSQDAFAAGIPNISAVVRGKKVYDPRSGSTAHSSNAALCILDYLRSSSGLAIKDSEWDGTWWTAQANLCDELVEIAADGTTQRRYAMNGSLTLDQLPLDVIDGMLTATGGVMTYQAGRYKLHCAAYAVPTVTLTSADLRGPVEVVAKKPRRELFNAIRGTYVSPDKNWQPTDFPPVLNSLYEVQDGNERIYRDVEFPWTQDAIAAQRIGKIVLERARQGIAVKFPAKLTAMQISAWDVVNLTLAEFGWTAKPFRVVSWSMSEDGGIDLMLQEEASASYSWNLGDATTVDPAPDTSLLTPLLPPAAPTALAVDEELYVTRNGDGVKALATLTWTASENPYVVRYRVEYRLTTDSTWIIAGETPATTFDIEDIAPGTYDFRVAAVNVLSVLSEYATASGTIAGLLDPPTAPQDLTIAAVSSLALIRWTQSPDLDVRIGGRIEIRHSPLTSGATWENSTSIAEAVPGSDTLALVPLKSGTYLLKAVDSSGLYSTSATSVGSDGATALTYTTLNTLTEDATFPGTKTGCSVSGSVLTLSGAGLFDDIPDFDACADLDGFGGQALEGTYDYATTIDLTSVKKVQASGHVKASLVNVNDNIDNRTADIDDWTDFDGSTGANGDVVVWVRTTQDNPSGSPTWSSWQRCDLAELSCRGVQFKAILSVADNIFNVEVSELRAYVKEVA